MSTTDSPSSSRNAFPLSWGQVAFLVALALTGSLLALGITGTHWPHWLLVLTDIL